MFWQDEVEQHLTKLLEVERLPLSVEADVVPADIALHLHLVVEEDRLEVGRPRLALLEGRVVLVPGVLEQPDVGGDVVHQLGGEVAHPVHHVDPLCQQGHRVVQDAADLI